MTHLFKACVVLGLLWGLSAAAQSRKLWTFDNEFDTGVLDSVNHDAPNNHQLQLNTSSSTEPYIWLANVKIGTVTKINTRTGLQEARYDSVLQRNWDGSLPSVRAPRDACNSPSRTAVDGDGNTFVANRSVCTGDVPSVTKIAGSAFNCVDRNRNGVIDTSVDANHNGIIELGNPLEFFGQSDECLLWTKNYGTAEDTGRSAAVDADQNLWVGGYYSSKLYKLDGSTGSLMQTIDPKAQTGVDSHIYGIAIGPGGFIYTSDPEALILQKIDPRAARGHEVVKWLKSCYATYGLAVDRNGIAWFGTWSEPNSLIRVDFDRSKVMAISAQEGGCQGFTRGVAVDGHGDIWVSCYKDAKLLRFNAAGTFLASYPVGTGPVGAAVDGDGRIWTSNWGDASASRFDPQTSATKSFPAGEETAGSRDTPYSYSDMTGFQQRNFTQRQGDWTVTHDAGQLTATWGPVAWNTEPQGREPEGTSITVEARAAESREDLARQPFREVSNGQPAPGLVGRFIELKATLRIQRGEVSPVLSDLSVAYLLPCFAVGLNDYNLFLLENYSGGHDVLGKVAAGGDISMSGFAVGSALPARDTANVLVAGHHLTLTEGAVWGDARYAGTYTTDPSVTFPRGAAERGAPIDFTARGRGLRALSARLHGLRVNGTTDLEPWGGITLRGTDAKVNVFQLDASAFTGARLLSIDAPAGSLAVVNITGASASFTAFGHSFSGGIDQHGVLYNFTDTTSIDAHAFGFWGTVLAPYARVTFNDGSWDGGLYALSLTGGAEGHISPLHDFTVCQ